MAKHKLASKKILKTQATKTYKAISLRIEETDLAKIQAKAKTYADGNVSEFIRYAALNFIPSEKDLI